MPGTVLVTGATGFIARHLLPALRAAGYGVRVHSHSDGDIASGPLDCDGVDHVVHLAAKTFVPESWTAPALFYRTNVLGTVNVTRLLPPDRSRIDVRELVRLRPSALVAHR